MFDATDNLNDEDVKLLKTISDVPAVAIINKTDQETIIDIDYIKSQIDNIVYISAKMAMV